MYKISIVPDTNILLLHLNLVKHLYTCNLGVLYTINYAKTVLDELDNLKKKNANARTAITFIESVSMQLKTEIEGKIDDRKLDIVIDTRTPIEAKNNDDKILNYCFKLENPIFLTNDKAFFLKCNSFNIKCIKVNDKKASEVVKEIHIMIGLTTRSKVKEAKRLSIARLKENIKISIEPMILSILEAQCGPDFFLILAHERTLEYYLDLVITHFSLFTGYLPKKSPNIIQELIKSLNSENLEVIKRHASNVCLLFRTNLREDLL